MTGSCKTAKMVAGKDVYKESRSRVYRMTFASGYAAMISGVK